jgi:hypothetical protein
MDMRGFATTPIVRGKAAAIIRKEVLEIKDTPEKKAFRQEAAETLRKMSKKSINDNAK